MEADTAEEAYTIFKAGEAYLYKREVLSPETVTIWKDGEVVKAIEVTPVGYDS